MSRLNMLNCIRNMVEVCLNSARSSTDLFSSLIGVRRDPFIVHCKYVESALELDVHCSKELNFAVFRNKNLNFFWKVPVNRLLVHRTYFEIPASDSLSSN